jgi:broad specificity phosphatase PhoE
MSYKRFPAAVLVAVLAAVASSAGAGQTVILVRHAEKADQSKDPPLSEAGRARAGALAALLAKAGVAAVYASEYQRTIQTAEPLAAALKLAVQTIPAADSAGLADRLRSCHADDVVLVVGHSNTLPDLMRRLGHETTETIDDNDYGNVFVLVPRPGRPPAVIRFRF